MISDSDKLKASEKISEYNRRFSMLTSFDGDVVGTCVGFLEGKAETTTDSDGGAVASSVSVLTDVG
jgi:hypothetical protein